MSYPHSWVFQCFPEVYFTPLLVDRIAVLIMPASHPNVMMFGRGLFRPPELVFWIATSPAVLLSYKQEHNHKDMQHSGIKLRLFLQDFSNLSQTQMWTTTRLLAVTTMNILHSLCFSTHSLPVPDVYVMKRPGSRHRNPVLFFRILRGTNTAKGYTNISRASFSAWVVSYCIIFSKARHLESECDVALCDCWQARSNRSDHSRSHCRYSRQKYWRLIMLYWPACFMHLLEKVYRRFKLGSCHWNSKTFYQVHQIASLALPSLIDIQVMKTIRATLSHSAHSSRVGRPKFTVEIRRSGSSIVWMWTVANVCSNIYLGGVNRVH